MANRAMYEAIRAMSYDGSVPPRRPGIRDLSDLPLSLAMVFRSGGRRVRRFYDNLQQKKFILEERLNPALLPSILAHRFPAWNKLAVCPLPDFDVQLVLEFYAALQVKAATGGDPESVRVRGYEVSFSDADIATYFGLPLPDSTGLDYHFILGLGIPSRYEELLREAHTLVSGRTRVSEFELCYTDLLPAFRPLKRFINTNLRPTRLGLESAVSDEELLLMYSLTRADVPINVGGIIRDAINGFAFRRSRYEAIPFPRLVSELCIKAIGYQHCIADHFYVQDQVDCSQELAFTDRFPFFRR